MRKEFDYTMLSTFMTCRRRYDYRINRGLVSKSPATPLTFGGAIHEGLDAWYTLPKKDRLEGALRAFNDHFKEDLEVDSKRTKHMGEWILKNYDKQYADQPWELVHSEMAFDLPFGERRFIGRIDKIIKWGDAMWVVDHKAQPMNSLILTPKGWKTMSSIKVGDFVIGSDGQPTKIKGIYPQGALQCYEVTFEDGSKVRCSEEHYWTVTSNYGKTLKTRTLKQIKRKMDEKYCGGERDHKFGVSCVEPVEFHKNSLLPLHPYLLGVILGDGCVTGHVVEISIGNEDAEELLSILREVLPPETVISKTKGDNLSYIVKTVSEDRKNFVIKALKKLGIMGKASTNKFIPKEYIFSSITNRLELLRGLLDTDGCCYKGHIYFDTVSPSLAHDVVDLVRSLGGVSRMRKRTGTVHQAYRVGIRLPKKVVPFNLNRKIRKMSLVKGKMVHYIKTIKTLGVENMQCISVEAKDGLYVTNDYILTHNTTSQLGPQFFKTAEPNLQFTGYVWAAKQLGYPVVGVILDAILVAKGLLPGPNKNNRLTPLARYDVYRSDEHLKEWQETVQSVMESVSSCELRNDWYPNFDACTYYGECPFRKVCKEDQDIRERIIASDYNVEFWSPKKEEEDHGKRLELSKG